jgi:hypothetical protein
MFYTKKIHRSLVALFMSAVLVFNFVSVNFYEIQEHFVTHSEIECNEENEADACHRYTIHHEKSEGCDGSHQHINSKHEECFSCKYTKERQSDIFYDDLPLVWTASDNVISDTNIRAVFSSAIFLTFLRGPPPVIS